VLSVVILNVVAPFQKVCHKTVFEKHILLGLNQVFLLNIQMYNMSSLHKYN
jgi:hypothetical protein